MEIKVYLHRTKKQDFKIADCFSVDIDFDKLPEDKKNDIEFVNQGFMNDCQRIAKTRDVIKKYGTGYVSFMRPQFEGKDEENGNDIMYFDNKEMLFMPVSAKPKKRARKKKEEPVTDEEKQQ